MTIGALGAPRHVLNTSSAVPDPDGEKAAVELPLSREQKQRGVDFQSNEIGGPRLGTRRYPGGKPRKELTQGSDPERGRSSSQHRASVSRAQLRFRTRFVRLPRLWADQVPLRLLTTRTSAQLSRFPVGGGARRRIFG